MERLHFYLFAILQREDFPTSVLGGGPKMIIEKQKLVKVMERLCSKSAEDAVAPFPNAELKCQ